MLIQRLLPNVDEELAKKQPDYLYHGAIPEDTDGLDYIEIKLQGVRVG